MQPLTEVILVDFTPPGHPSSIGIERQSSTGPWLDVYDVFPDSQEEGMFVLRLAQDRPLTEDMIVIRTQFDVYWACPDLNIIQMGTPYTRLTACPDLTSFWEKIQRIEEE